MIVKIFSILVLFSLATNHLFSQEALAALVHSEKPGKLGTSSSSGLPVFEFRKDNQLSELP